MRLTWLIVGALALTPLAVHGQVARDASIGEGAALEVGRSTAEFSAGQQNLDEPRHSNHPAGLQSAKEAEMMDIEDLASSEGIELSAAIERYGYFDELLSSATRLVRTSLRTMPAAGGSTVKE